MIKVQKVQKFKKFKKFKKFRFDSWIFFHGKNPNYKKSTTLFFFAKWVNVDSPHLTPSFFWVYQKK